MATFSEVRDKVYRVLADPSASQYGAALIDDGIVAALEAILPWVFKRSSVILEADGETTEFELPVDLYRITAVFDADSGLYLKQNTMSAGDSPGSDLNSNQDWMEYPELNLSLANAPDSDITVFYGATWAVPEADEDELETPAWCTRAIVFYAASYALLEKSSSAANIRQWNVQVDSGTPVMNPMKDMSTYYLERFRIEMERMPARIRGVHG
jgi:hypothetical protein